jgi:excinuclease ABC subunit A
MQSDFSSLEPKKFILIKGAQLHNLKNIDVAIPRNQMVVITGLSGSGKSSLAFDTLYAEGQRRYVESLSSYARQFLGKLDKPKVEYIKGIAPAIAIEQKVNTTNARSSVGTSTEIYDYLKLLFARIGRTYSPISGEEVKKHTVSDVVKHIQSLEIDTKWLLLAPIHLEKGRKLHDKLNVLLQQGFARVLVDNQTVRLDDFVSTLEMIDESTMANKEILLVVDRIVVQSDEEFLNRIADALQIAFYEGKGELYLQEPEKSNRIVFNSNFQLDGLDFLEPNIHLFSFNNPYGACPTCEGYGSVIGIDEELVVPNTALSVYENAIFPWRGESMGWYRDQLVNNSHHFDFPIHKPYFELSDAHKALIWNGNKYFTGLNAFFADLEANNYKIQNRVMLSRYRGKTKCHACNGKRLRSETNNIKVAGKTISDLVDLPIIKLIPFFNTIELSEYDEKVAKRLLLEIKNRLAFLDNVGLNYLSLNRQSASLSGGESQRINLATSLGSSLVGSMYILDEPSIGLHPKDTEKLIEVLLNLKKLGNTVIIVEHDEDIMKAADMIIDIGPEAGTLGGNLVAQGTYEEILKSDPKYINYVNGVTLYNSLERMLVNTEREDLLKKLYYIKEGQPQMEAFYSRLVKDIYKELDLPMVGNYEKDITEMSINDLKDSSKFCLFTACLTKHKLESVVNIVDPDTGQSKVFIANVNDARKTQRENWFTNWKTLGLDNKKDEVISTLNLILKTIANTDANAKYLFSNFNQAVADVKRQFNEIGITLSDKYIQLSLFKIISDKYPDLNI